MKHYVALLYASKPDKQIEKAETIFSILSKSEKLVFVDSRYKTEASLTFDSELLWTEAYGGVQLGDSLIFPAGEIAITHQDFDNATMQTINGLNGQVALSGMPIVHWQMPKQFISAEEQQRIFSNLFNLNSSAIIADIKFGRIVNLKAASKEVEPALKTLTSLFELDNRLTVINEIGLGIDDNVQLLPENTALNEGFAGQGVCIHFGIGGHQMIIHFDVVMPETKIYAISASKRYAIHTVPSAIEEIS